MQASEQEHNRIALERPVSPPSPRIPIPPMTVALVGVNLLMALVEFAASGYRWQGGQLGTGPVGWALGAKVPSLVANGEYWRLITASFLHGSWVHLAFNMLALLALGRLIEAFYGPMRMLVIYILASIAGTMLSYKLSMTVSLGASTGILGLMGALLYHNMKYRRFLPERLNSFYPFLLFLLITQLMMDSASRETDVLGHLGGLLGGIGAAALLESRIAGPLQDERDWLPLPTALLTVAAFLAYGAFGLIASLPSELPLLRAARTGDLVTEVRQLQQAIQHRPYFVEARFQLVEYLVLMNRGEEALEQYQEVLRQNPSIQHSGEGQSTQEYLAKYFLIRASAADNAGRPEEALVNYRHILDLGLDPAYSLSPTGPSLLALAHNGYAYVLADKLNRNLDDAERSARTALGMLPNDGAVWDTFAWVLYRKGDYAQALREQLRAVELVKRESSTIKADAMAEVLYHLGADYEKLGKITDARQAYRSALDSRPGYAPARAALQRLDRPEPPLHTPAPAPTISLPDAPAQVS